MDLTRITSKFNFYQQIRTILKKLRDGKTSDDELLNNKFQLVSSLSLEAQDGQVADIKQDGPESPLLITLWQNGLTGADGALPTAYCEWMIERRFLYGDHSAKAFLDIFGHRIYCLDYLAWQKNHPYALAEANGQFSLRQVLLALSGVLHSFPEVEYGSYAHLFSGPVRSMVNLETWLSHYYSVPVKITPFAGGWQDVGDAEHCQLGQPRQILGCAPMLGRVRWDIQTYFDVTLGPLEQGYSQHFTPKGKYYLDIWSRIRTYVGPGLSFTIHLIISNLNTVQLPLGTGQLGVDMCVGRYERQLSHKICLPVCES